MVRRGWRGRSTHLQWRYLSCVTHVLVHRTNFLLDRNLHATAAHIISVFQTQHVDRFLLLFPPPPPALGYIYICVCIQMIDINLRLRGAQRFNSKRTTDCCSSDGSKKKEKNLQPIHFSGRQDYERPTNHTHRTSNCLYKFNRTLLFITVFFFFMQTKKKSRKSRYYGDALWSGLKKKENW